MKKVAWVIVIAGFLGSTAAWAKGPFDWADLSACEGAEVTNNGYRVHCKDAASYEQVVRAKVGKNVKRLPKRVASRVLDAIELRVMPDADTDQVYRYTRELRGRGGKLVGYLVIDGYVNSEWDGVGVVKLLMRYNNFGELVFADYTD